jgi:hypothetical protein
MSTCMNQPARRPPHVPLLGQLAILTPTASCDEARATM